MDEQAAHDREMAKRKMKLEPGSRQRLEALLAKKSAASSKPERSSASDPIANAMKWNPGLTRETAEEMAAEYGF